MSRPSVRQRAFVHHAADTSATGIEWAGFTPELLQRARDRVRIICWFVLVAIALGALIDLAYVRLVVGPWAWAPAWLVSTAATLALSLGVVLAARDRRISDLVVVKLALVFEVVLSLMLAVTLPWFIYVDSGVLPWVTWVTPIIIMFPMMVPTPPRITLTVAMAAAATRPVGLFLLSQSPDIVVTSKDYILSLPSPLLAVGLAYFGSRVVHEMTTDLAEARKMGSYRLERKLGQGGMGEVWLAKHQLLARPAAVKMIRPQAVAASAAQQRLVLARFEREAQATASLRSQHTIQLYDFGIARGGSFYYVMELLDGFDAHTLVARFGPTPPSRAIHLLRQACDSLGEAHERGLVHRDMKPANVFVCRYGREVDFVKVLDFGLVKVQGELGGEDGNLTVEGSVGGTPNFIAPEQVLGDEVDGRADIYALGCVAYWMLSGEYVFQGATPLKTMMMHVEAPPTAPSSASRQPIPEDLDRLVLRCLQKDPAERPQTADDLAAQLTSIEIVQTWAGRPAREWWDQNAPV
jgi:serine/threonine-protein kinase